MEEEIKTEEAQPDLVSKEAQVVSAEQVNKLIRKHVYTSMAVGLVPIPVVDFAGVTGVQINLVRKLANLYDVPFSKETTKNIIISLIGGTVPAVSSFPIASAIKAIPIIGFSLGAVTMPVISGASTFAVGKVFYRHFASGGTFLTLDVEKAKQYYEEMFHKGKNVSQTLQAQPA
ncbi:MAG: DUF697 domain-containing protein [Candidatus Magnetomorum sp.]|nr:DUF697 domain-containing protein [Candidatus Magnetomorum sp.]